VDPDRALLVPLVDRALRSAIEALPPKDRLRLRSYHVAGLTLAQIGYCAPDDPRMLSTVAAIEADLLHDGLLLRYRTASGVDGLDGDEHPFLACSFWLVQQYASSGRLDDAERLMDRLVGFANDVGMLSEEYDTRAQRHAGNTPQAFSHLTLVRAADAIARARE
jgi:GH15 family glucan-1,4-alpha-glucosidase